MALGEQIEEARGKVIGQKSFSVRNAVDIDISLLTPFGMSMT
jgi:hypothetical protein